MRMGLPRYWVNTAALSLVVSDSDYSYAGAGPAVAMTRTYNSNSLRSGMFGRRWSFSFEEMTQTVLCSIEPAVVRKGEGNFLRFEKPVSVCDSGSARQVSATPVYPLSNHDALTYYYSGTPGNDYWLYYARQEKTTYRYGRLPQLPYWHLTTIHDRNNRAVTIAYNPAGTISTITDAAGRVSAFAYDADNHCVRMDTPDGLSSFYGYDLEGNLVSSTDLMGNVTSYAYDAEGNMLSLSAGGRTTSFAYDHAVTPGRLLTVTDAAGRTQTYTKGTTTAGNAAIDAAGTVSWFAADAEGASTGTIDPLGQTTAKQYTDGLLTSYTDSAGGARSIGYDERAMCSRSRTDRLIPRHSTPTMQMTIRLPGRPRLVMFIPMNTIRTTI